MTSLERTVSTALRAGVTLAALVAGAGGACYLAEHGSEPASFAEPAAALRTVGGIISGALTFRSEWIIALGLLLLIATPVVRVALLVFAFARARDAIFVALSALVLTVLLVSL
jgi:uncharacterized membrane protein